MFRFLKLLCSCSFDGTECWMKCQCLNNQTQKLIVPQWSKCKQNVWENECESCSVFRGITQTELPVIICLITTGQSFVCKSVLWCLPHGQLSVNKTIIVLIFFKSVPLDLTRDQNVNRTHSQWLFFKLLLLLLYRIWKPSHIPNLCQKMKIYPQ